MNRIFCLSASLALIVSASGCGCCDWMYPKPQPVAVPVQQCAPACAGCDACGGVGYGTIPPATYGGAPVTYGGATTYAP